MEAYNVSQAWKQKDASHHKEERPQGVRSALQGARQARVPREGRRADGADKSRQGAHVAGNAPARGRKGVDMRARRGGRGAEARGAGGAGGVRDAVRGKEGGRRSRAAVNVTGSAAVNVKGSVAGSAMGIWVESVTWSRVGASPCVCASEREKGE